MTLAAEKAALRKVAAAARAAAHGAAAPKASTVLAKVLADYRGVPLSGYHPIRSEIDPLPALAEAAAWGPVGLPVIEGAGLPLSFRLWSPDCAMQTGAYGAQIPAAVQPMTPRIVILPLLAFDRSGGRLGYGGGFYDRTLAQLRTKAPTRAIGFAYAAQEVAAVPMEAMDMPLDMVITEAGVIEISRG